VHSRAVSSGSRVDNPLDWVNVAFIAFAHAVAALAVVYLVAVRFSWWTVGLGFLYAVVCGLSVTGGYHRLFAHRAYRANRLVRASYLFFGAAAVQNSALAWCDDHRLHHARTDTERDPYNIRKGFWWAHIGWVFHKMNARDPRRVPDLRADRLVLLQDRHLLAITILAGAVLPFCLGFVWGDPWGALLVAGFLRLVVQWHSTFAINSVAHVAGKQTYGTRTSARDSAWLAFFTMGEGYHNFHHTFPSDYRNGVRWHQFDPTKWLIGGLALVGLTAELKRTPPERIEKALEEGASVGERPAA
jgi:stearoyl-CoA desaturase (delta-9 desaturase)